MRLLADGGIERYFRKRHVLITGGSEGVGFALARRLVTLEAEVSLVSRNRDKLELARDRLLAEMPNARVDLIAADVGDAQSIAALFPTSLGERSLDVLINNAGVSRPGYFEELPASEFQRMMDVNFFGTVNLTRQLLPVLKRARGHVTNVGSLSSVIATLGHAAYCSSKFALYGFSDALRAELVPHGVAVSLALLPEVETQMLVLEEPYLPAATRVIQRGAGRLSPDQAAVSILRGMAARRFEIVPGGEARLARIAAQVAPSLLRSWFDWVARNA